MLPIYLFIMLLSCIAIAYHNKVLDFLVDFQVNRVHPSQLSKQIQPFYARILFTDIVVLILHFFAIKKLLLSAIINCVAMLLFFYANSRNNSLYDPLKIVRDLMNIRKIHICLLVVNFLTIVYCLVLCGYIICTTIHFK